MMPLGAKPFLQNVFERDVSEVKNLGQIPKNDDLESMPTGSIVDSVYLS